MAIHLLLSFGFELMVNKLPLLGIMPQHHFGDVPKYPDNLFWMMTCLSGELFFVSAITFLLMATQTEVARWVLLIPLEQYVYNIKMILFGLY